MITLELDKTSAEKRAAKTNTSTRSAPSRIFQRTNTRSCSSGTKATELRPTTRRFSNLNARERVAENNRLRSFDGMQKNLKNNQSKFLQVLETLKITSPDKTNYYFKFITLVQNGECKILVNDEDLLRLPQKLPLYSVADLRNDITTTMVKIFMDFMNQMEVIQCADSTYLGLKQDKIQKEVDKQQERITLELNSAMNILCSESKKETDSQIKKMQKQLNDGRKIVAKFEKKFDDLKMENDKKMEIMERNLKSKYDNDLAKGDLQKNVKVATKQTEKLGSIERNEAIINSTVDIKEYKKTVEQDMHLEEKKNQETRTETAESCGREEEKEILPFKKAANALENDMQIQLDLAKEDCSKIAVFPARENEYHDPSTWPVDSRNEIVNYRPLEIEKQENFEILNKLSRANCLICELKKQIQRDLELLKVRKSLINALKTNRKKQRVDLKKMIAKIEEKDVIINELSSKYQKKSDEFNNLFDIFSSERKKLKRLEQTTKLVEQRNECNEKLCRHHKEKIGCMENEIFQLKQPSTKYRKKIADARHRGNRLSASMSTDNEHYDNLYLCANGRRRLRNVTINVKKYEI